MNPENAWNSLRAHAAAQLKPGFPDRVLRAARAGAEAAPSLLGQFALSAATAALCFLAVALFNAQTTRAEAESSLAAWQDIASASQFVDGGQTQ
jgi:hypothetical protein